MSFILDALKKSENERQRQIGPSLADIPFRRARTERPWWAVAVAALLVINLGVLIVVLMRNRSAEPAQSPPTQSTAVQPQLQPSPTPQPQPRTSSAPPAMTAEPMVSNPAVRSLAEEANADDELPSDMPVDSAMAAAAVPEGPPVVRPVAPPNVAPVNSQQNMNATGRPATQDDNEVLPTLNSLVASGTSLPDMRLDIHVYSPNPAERFVFVNMRKYAEGQTLTEGPVVERIRTDGAVLNHRGTRFLLPRQ